MENSILFWVFCAVFLTLTAYLNNRQRLNNIRTGVTTQVNHTLWFAVFAPPVIAAAFLINWKVALSGLLLRGSFFPVTYNLFAKIDPFSLSRTTTSKYDEALVKIVTYLNKKFDLGLEDYDAMLVPDILCLVLSAYFLWNS